MWAYACMCLVLVIGMAGAQSFPPTLPDQITTLLSTDSRCNTSAFQTAPWTRTTFTQYTSGFTGPNGVCYLTDIITPCATLGGAVGCNRYNEKCTEINSNIDFTSAVLHPEIVAVTTQRPAMCASQGAFFHPDAIVFAVVLIIIGWLLLIALLVYVMVAMRELQPGGFLNFVIVFSFGLATLLLFSYYYLNGVLVLGCVYVSYSLFSVRRSDCTAFGLFILLGGMLWTMHAAALGWVQHMSRFGSDATGASTSMCVQYYRGYFAYPAGLRSDFDNPLRDTDRLCRREWLGAELFFMILFQLILLLAVVAGATVQNSATPIRQVKVSEVDRQDSA